MLFSPGFIDSRTLLATNGNRATVKRLNLHAVIHRVLYIPCQGVAYVKLDQIYNEFSWSAAYARPDRRSAMLPLPLPLVKDDFAVRHAHVENRPVLIGGHQIVTSYIDLLVN